MQNELDTKPQHSLIYSKWVCFLQPVHWEYCSQCQVQRWGHYENGFMVDRKYHWNPTIFAFEYLSSRSHRWICLRISYEQPITKKGGRCISGGPRWEALHVSFLHQHATMSGEIEKNGAGPEQRRTLFPIHSMCKACCHPAHKLAAILRISSIRFGREDWRTFEWLQKSRSTVAPAQNRRFL